MSEKRGNKPAGLVGLAPSAKLPTAQIEDLRRGTLRHTGPGMDQRLPRVRQKHAASAAGNSDRGILVLQGMGNSDRGMFTHTATAQFDGYFTNVRNRAYKPVVGAPLRRPHCSFSLFPIAFSPFPHGPMPPSPVSAQEKRDLQTKVSRCDPATTYPTGPFPAKYYQRAEA